jgi:hypothetical protein
VSRQQAVRRCSHVALRCPHPAAAAASLPSSSDGLAHYSSTPIPTPIPTPIRTPTPAPSRLTLLLVPPLPSPTLPSSRGSKRTLTTLASQFASQRRVSLRGSPARRTALLGSALPCSAPQPQSQPQPQPQPQRRLLCLATAPPGAPPRLGQRLCPRLEDVGEQMVGGARVSECCVRGW